MGTVAAGLEGEVTHRLGAWPIRLRDSKVNQHICGKMTVPTTYLIASSDTFLQSFQSALFLDEGFTNSTHRGQFDTITGNSIVTLCIDPIHALTTMT